MKTAIRSRVFGGAVASAIVFWVLIHTVPLDTLIAAFNGVFFGCMAAVLVAFGPLLWNTLRGGGPYDRVRQMTLGWFLCWVAYVISSYTSVYSRSIGYPPPMPSTLTLISRYVAVLAAILQVTAPDFGLGIFHGRDRKTLWTGFSIGLVVALFLFYAQDSELFAGWYSQAQELPLYVYPAQP